MDAFFWISVPAPSQMGSGPLIPMAAAIRIPEKHSAKTKACFNTCLASRSCLAPIFWAAWTENPVATALHRPFSSHVLVETTPIAADAPAPKFPTMAVSIYCIIMEVSCARIAGTLNRHTMDNFCPRPGSSSCRSMAASNCSFAIFLFAFIFIFLPVLFHNFFLLCRSLLRCKFIAPLFAAGYFKLFHYTGYLTMIQLFL